MNKFKKATKRIAAVGTSALVASTGAFGASLADYPNNFVSDGKFNGWVVIGSDSTDSAAAVSIIDDLKSEFSGDQEKVKIVYKEKSSSSNGKEIQFTDSGNDWNYGETTLDVRTTAFDDTDDSDVFSEDRTFDNGFSDEDYSEELEFQNNSMVFEHALRDDVADEISTHLYIEDINLMVYTLALDSTMSNVGTQGEQSDFIGEDIVLLGKDFTITEIGFDNVTGLDRMTIIGGSNKITLGEGDSVEVTIDGESHTVKVLGVDDDDVQLTIDGVSKVIDEFDTEKVAGVNVGVTEILNPSRDNVQGYAELVVGGEEIELQDGQQVRINDKDITDIDGLEDYDAEVSFQGSGGGWTGLTITYSLDDEVMLMAGESLDEWVFSAFSIHYEGTNDVEWSHIKVDVSSDELGLTGEAEQGEEFNEKIAALVDETSASSEVRLIGNSDDDALLVADFAAGSQLNTSQNDFDNQTGIKVTAGGSGAGTVSLSTGGNAVTLTSGTPGNVGNFIVNYTSAQGGMLNITGINLSESDGFRFLAGTDLDQLELWDIVTYSESNDEIDFNDLLGGNSEKDVGSDEISAKLDELSSSTGASGVVTALSGLSSQIAFENEALINLAEMAQDNISLSRLTYDLDSNDADADDEPADITDSQFNLTFSVDTDDEEFNIALSQNQFSTLIGDAEAEVEDGDSDVKEYVTKYGTKVRIDSDDSSSDSVDIWTPSEQVKGMVWLVTGESSSSTTQTITVDADAADAKVEELEDDGYTVVSQTDVDSEEVEFDITAPALDTEVSGEWEDMIVVGGPAVNEVAANLLGLSFPTSGTASGVGMDEAVVRYFSDANSVLVYGYEEKDTAAAADKLNAGGLSGSSVNV